MVIALHLRRPLSHTPIPEEIRMNTHTRMSRIGALALVTATALLPAAAAQAKDGDVIRRGSCSGSADWKLKASPENGRIEVEGEVDSNRNGQSWNWRIKHNGSLSASGSRTTKAPSGSFTVRRVVVNLKGADNIVFKARHPNSGQVCRGALTF
jgi:hypothetical protein